MKSARGAYSTDLREKILDAIDENGWTNDEGAAFFSVGVASIFRWRRRRKERGSPAPLPHGGGQPRKITPEHDRMIAEIIFEKNDRTLLEIRRELARRSNLKVSDGPVCDAIVRLGLTLKKSR